jgi:propionyl-CoA carboxylase alpha chain
LANILRHEAFLAGDTTTHFIEKHNPPRDRDVTEGEVRTAALAVALAQQQAHREAARVLATIPSGWRNNPSAMQEVRFTHQGDEVAAKYIRDRSGTFRYEVGEHSGAARVLRAEQGWIELEVDGVQRLISSPVDGPRRG